MASPRHSSVVPRSLRGRTLIPTQCWVSRARRGCGHAVVASSPAPCLLGVLGLRRSVFACQIVDVPTAAPAANRVMTQGSERHDTTYAVRSSTACVTGRDDLVEGDAHVDATAQPHERSVPRPEKGVTRSIEIPRLLDRMAMTSMSHRSLGR